MAASSPSRSDPTEPATLLSLVPPRPRRRIPRSLLVILGVVVLVGAVGLVGLLRANHGGPPRPGKPAFTVTALAPKPGSVVPRKAAPAPVQLAEWSATIAERTDIPARVALAYGAAEQRMRSAEPGCRLSWTTLAGLGRVESSHGEYGGTEVLADGRLSRPIIGVPLDGHTGVQAVKDTDRGELDGDAVWDRAVGSMQFVPATWHKWGVRASGDGRAPDPQNVDDAALTSARYLCGAGRDLSTPKGWWQGVLTYNESVSYGRKVFSGADAYARAGGAG